MPLQYIENVIFGMCVRSQPFRVRLKPPFGNGVPAIGFRSIGFENRADSSHRIDATVTWREDYRRSRHNSFNWIHELFRMSRRSSKGRLTSNVTGAPDGRSPS